MRKEEFSAKMVRIHFSHKDQWNGKPLYEAILSVCMDLGLAGATVYQGVEGFGLSAHIHHSSLWPGSNDPPIMISIIDREEDCIPPASPRQDGRGRRRRHLRR